MAAIIAFFAYNLGSQIKNLEIRRKSDKSIPPTLSPIKISSTIKSTTSPSTSSSTKTPKMKILHTLKPARLRTKSQKSFAKEQRRYNREMKILKKRVEKEFGEWSFQGLDLYGGEIEVGEGLSRVESWEGGKLRRVRGKRVRFSVREIWRNGVI